MQCTYLSLHAGGFFFALLFVCTYTSTEKDRLSTYEGRVYTHGGGMKFNALMSLECYQLVIGAAAADS